jgi:RNA polymerase sigma-70 factor (ECF subfamily)
MAESDADIWLRIKQGDTKSLESLFDRYHDRLCLYSFGIVSNENAAEEIVNDIFFKIWSRRDHIHIKTGIKPYLYRSVFNASAEYLNKSPVKKESSNVEIDRQIMELAGSNEEYIFNVLQDEEIDRDVLNAIEKLPGRCKEIFCLSRFELLSYAEIAEQLNISVNTVKTQIGRALENLRKQLQQYL